MLCEAVSPLPRPPPFLSSVSTHEHQKAPAAREPPLLNQIRPNVRVLPIRRPAVCATSSPTTSSPPSNPLPSLSASKPMHQAITASTKPSSASSSSSDPTPDPGPTPPRSSLSSSPLLSFSSPSSCPSSSSSSSFSSPSSSSSPSVNCRLSRLPYHLLAD